MKKYTITIILLLPSFAFAQSVYMHEAQDDATNSEPTSLLGIIVLLILVGFVYFIVKVIKGEMHKREKRKRATDAKEFDRKYSTIKAGGFICPFCGKHVVDNNYRTMIRYYDNVKIKVKCCNTCAERYDLYLSDSFRYRKNNDELPLWLRIIVTVLILGSGLYALTYNCIKGDVFDGIIGLFIVPMGVGGLLGVIIWFCQTLLKATEQKLPFKAPTLQHIRECNAIQQ